MQLPTIKRHPLVGQWKHMVLQKNRGFSEGGGGGGGGANGNAWHMAVAAGRVPLKLLLCVLNVCS